MRNGDAQAHGCVGHAHNPEDGAVNESEKHAQNQVQPQPGDPEGRERMGFWAQEAETQGEFEVEFREP
jgi:hypothetical protein